MNIQTRDFKVDDERIIKVLINLEEGDLLICKQNVTWRNLSLEFTIGQVYVVDSIARVQGIYVPYVKCNYGGEYRAEAEMFDVYHTL